MGLTHGNAKDTFLPVTKLGLLENCKTEMISEEKYFVILVCKVYNVAQQYLKPFCLPLNMSELKTQTLCCIVVKRVPVACSFLHVRQLQLPPNVSEINFKQCNLHDFGYPFSF